MPELPEVETTVRGIRPHIKDRFIGKMIMHEKRLRWPVDVPVECIEGYQITDVSRRGKYILISVDTGTLIWHLGMSGSMRISSPSRPLEKHDHVEIQFDHNRILRFRDPRRFGSLFFTTDDPFQHWLLRKLGPEPLSEAFNTAYFYALCQKRQASIKSIIMNSHHIVGIGNIYASEALFRAGIRPTRTAASLSKQQLSQLVSMIKTTLQAAIDCGGTTLQDFNQVNGKPGYFKQSLQVYGVKGDCSVCGNQIQRIIQNQRASYFCPRCQT